MESRSRLVPQLGSVNELYSRLQMDPNFLENVDGLPFIDTPLHDASASGNIDMAMELMNLKPSFARKLNADGLSPLHLAVANNQVELALQLVKFHPSLIRFPGRKGMTPLHLVASNGGVYFLTKFLLACPESIKDENFNGETALHIAIKENKYEELKLLLGWLEKLRSGDALATEIHVLNSCDLQGNTALHLAASGNNHEVVRQLLKCRPLNRNIMNKKGDTPLDVLRANGARMKKHTEKLLQKSGGKTKTSILGEVKPRSDDLRAPVNFWVYCFTIMARYRSRMPENTRNALLVITALIITSTYTTAITEDKLEDDTISKLLDNVTVNRSNVIKLIPRTDANLTEIAESHEFRRKKREIEIGRTILWGCNNTAYLLSVAWTFILLPAGREYSLWYSAIIVTLTISFALSTYKKYVVSGYGAFSPSDDDTSYLMHIYLIAVVVFLVYLIVFYLRWKWNKQMKVPEPKTEHISQGCKSWRSSLCC